MWAWFRSLLGATAGEELGAPDLRERVVQAIAALAERDDQGRQALPEQLAITLRAPAPRLELARRFLDDPGWEPALEAALLNCLYGTPRERLPLRRYVLEEGPEVAVAAHAQALGPLALLCVRGGDRDGARAVVPPLRRAFLLGRTELHGGESMEYNDLVVSMEDRYVSRRAAAIHRQGARLWVEARDQADCLILERSDGARLRPANTAGRRLELRPGDQLHFTDGQGAGLVVQVLAPEAQG